MNEVTENQMSSYVKGVGYCTSYPKVSMFCALPQNYQHLFEKKKVMYVSYSKFPKELKNSIKI